MPQGQVDTTDLYPDMNADSAEPATPFYLVIDPNVLYDNHSEYIITVDLTEDITIRQPFEHLGCAFVRDPCESDDKDLSSPNAIVMMEGGNTDEYSPPYLSPSCLRDRRNFYCPFLQSCVNMCNPSGPSPAKAEAAASKEFAPPLDLSHHFSYVTNRRNASSVKRFYKYFTIPGIQNLAGGLPNPGYFPYDTLEAQVALPNRFKPTPNKPVDPPTEELARTKLSEKPEKPEAARVIVPHDSSEANVLRKIDLTTALQYGTAQGYPPLYAFIRAFTQTALHPNVPYKGGPEVVLTVGSTDGFSKSIEAFSNVWNEETDWIRDRPAILCEEFAYMNAIQAARPRGLAVVPVKIDDEGMLADGKGGLADILENWDKYKGRKPHLMYTVTMGQNPTSGLLSLARRKQIYTLCQKHDILIIEDDPYWYLQYPSANALSLQTRGKPISSNHPITPVNYNTADGGKSSGFPFLDSLVPSYLSVDTDGRVIRLDTFSKTIAPGCRLGWITAQPAFVDKFTRIAETGTQQPSGFVQSLVAELIMGPSTDAEDPGRGGSKDGSGWKADGWVRWLEGLRGNYERRMQIMAGILDEGKYLLSGHATPSYPVEDSGFEVVTKTQIYDFAYPMAGMFLWLKAHFETHNLFKKCGGPKLSQALWVFLTTEKYRVLLAPGSLFSPTDEIREAKGWQYYRLCFAAVDDKVVKTSSEAFVACLRDFWGIEDEKYIDQLIKDGEEEVSEVVGRQMGAYAVNPIMC